MEDMARLALVEQDVRDSERFSKILYELLRHINNILENPHDYELRTIKSELLRKLLHREAFADYMKSIGFRPVGEDYIYPKESTLSNLRIAQAAIERKIYFCCGSLNRKSVRAKSSHSLPVAKKPKFVAANVLNTQNYLLLKIERLFNDMIKYENEDLQEMAREHMPLVTLQLMAIDRVREHQLKLKSGEIQGRELTYDIALMLELLGWFKGSFFSWVDKPPCEQCGGATAMLRTAAQRTPQELCNVELYKCTVCPEGRASFPRYNDLATLLRTRRGRCGEWANCFTLMCRALGYDTRYVYDTTDHVWCEIFDYDSNRWLHVDPCEGKLDSPLMYAVGWNKKPSYVIAVSCDDLQDVTWRYTVDHKKVLERRKECAESELIHAILTLREHRQRQVSEARRRYLARRCLQELARLMVERKPSDYETHGRISGSREWRETRGEIGLAGHGFVFQFDRPGKCCIKYFTALDKYRISFNDEDKEYQHWNTAVYESRNVFRKHEPDWQMVYLAREEGQTSGSISWKLCAASSLALRGLWLRARTAAFDTGAVRWLLAFDDTDIVQVDVADFTRGSYNWLLHARYVRGEHALCLALADDLQKQADNTHRYAHYIKGAVLADAGRLQEALEKFHSCIRLQPQDPEPVKQVAKCLFRQGRYQLSLEAYLEADKLSKHPDPDIYCALAECAFNTGDVDRGIEWARSAMQSGGGERAAALLARLLMTGGHVGEALAVYDQALSAHACSADTLAAAGALRLRAGDPRRAFQLLGAALALQPAQHGAALALAAMMLQHKDVDAALARLKTALSAHPTCVAAHANLGLALLAKKKYVAVLLIAIALERLGDSRADAAYFRAATLAPEDPLIRLNTAGRHARAGRLGDAVAEAAVLAALLENRPDSQLASGLASLLGQLRDAGAELSRLPEKLPEADVAIPAGAEDLEERLAADEV